MNIVLDGNLIKTEKDFHYQLSEALNIHNFYGNNIDALWDLLSANVERPFVLIWKNSEISKLSMGSIFPKIIDIFDRVENQDKNFGWKDVFSYKLE